MKSNKYTPKRLEEDHIFPHGLSKQEKAVIDKELLKLRTERWNNRSSEEKLRDRLLQLKYQMEDSTASHLFEEEYHFGYFLSSYIQIIDRKQKVFAREINIDETRLSRIIHKKEDPNDELLIRLELHSGNIIPALNWFRVVEKEKAHYIDTDTGIRKREKKFVTGTIGIRI